MNLSRFWHEAGGYKSRGEEDRQRQREFQQQQVQTYLSANILEISRMGSHEISETLVSKRTTRKAEREQIEIRISKTKKKGECGIVLNSLQAKAEKSIAETTNLRWEA